MNPRRTEPLVRDRRSPSLYDVNNFGAGLPEPLSFPGAGRKRDATFAIAARKRRDEAGEAARLLLRGGLREEEVYVAAEGDSLLDLATCGALREYLGRQRRRWHGYADQAHALKAKWGRDYAAFCASEGIAQVIQVVVRAPVSVFPLASLRASHAQDSARLGDRLRYGRKRIAPDLSCDLIGAEIRSVGQHGAEVDLHFHLAVRASAKDCRAMRSYFEASGWSWWDSLTGGSAEIERYPGALAQYASKSLAEAIRDASEDGVPFSPKNLAELHRQTRHLAMVRPTGAFRAWKGQLERNRLVVVEDENGRLTTRPRRRMSTFSRLRDRLFTSTGSRLLCLTLHDFGDGTMRPAIRVRGRDDVTFGEIAATYEVADAVVAARRALISLGSTAIPESFKPLPCGGEGRSPPWSSRTSADGCQEQHDAPW